MGAEARFNHPAGIARDPEGNLFVTEWLGHTIRKITPEGVVTRVAGTPGVAGMRDGPGRSALLNTPDGIVSDGLGNLYFTEYGNHTVRRLGVDGIVTTLAGTGVAGFRDGDASVAQFDRPGGITLGYDGALIVADTENHSIRRIVWPEDSGPVEPAAYISLHPGITVFGTSGKTYQVEATEDGGSTWLILGRFTLSGAIQTWFDPLPAVREARLYRVRELD